MSTDRKVARVGQQGEGAVAPVALSGQLVPVAEPELRLDGLAAIMLESARSQGVSLVGPNGVLAGLGKQVLEAALRAELTEHLGYEKHSPAGDNSGNSRNGFTPKTVRTELGEITIDVPRDRAGTFTPTVVPKNVRRISGFDQTVISLYARGMTTGDIAVHVSDLYGVDVSRDLVSTVTDQVLDDMKAWQSRALDPVVPVILIDAIMMKVRHGTVANRPVYVATAITFEGVREVLGMWVGPTGEEGAKYWLSVLTELKNCGVQDVFIVACDGLKGLPESIIITTWPAAKVQLCVVHMVRGSLKYAAKRDWKAITPALRRVYIAPSVAAAADAFDDFELEWGQRYPAIIRLWRGA